MVVTFNDVAGLESQKMLVYETLAQYLDERKKKLFSSLILAPDKVRNRKTYLLYGPPGVGKSFFVETLANTMGFPYEYFSSTQFLQGLVGKGAQDLRSVYQGDESVIFLDEIDAIGKDRKFLSNTPIDDVLLELLNCLDGPLANDKKITFAATNRVEMLDPALTSRFSYKMNFYLPDAAQREKIISKKLSYYKNKVSSLDNLVSQTEGFDGRMIDIYLNSAANKAVSDNRDYILLEDFKR